MPTNYPRSGAGFNLLPWSRQMSGDEYSIPYYSLRVPAVMLTGDRVTVGSHIVQMAQCSLNDIPISDLTDGYLRLTHHFTHGTSGVQSVERVISPTQGHQVGDVVIRFPIEEEGQRGMATVHVDYFVYWCRHLLHIPLTHIASMLGGDLTASQVGARYRWFCSRRHITPYEGTRSTSRRTSNRQSERGEDIDDLPSWLTNHIDWFNTLEISFGNELEVMGLSCRSAVEAVLGVGADCSRDTNYRHDVEEGWKAVPDGSVSGGCEVVSPVLHGSEGFIQLRRVMLGLKRAGGRITARCGGHVHFGVENLTASDRARIVEAHARYQPLFDRFVARGRLSNTFCRPRSNMQADALAEVFLQGYPRRETRVGGDRYMNLNVCSWVRYGTFEMRQHEGCLNPKKMFAWLCLNMAFIKACCEADDYSRGESTLMRLLATDGMTTENMLTHIARESEMPEGVLHLIQSFLTFATN